MKDHSLIDDVLAAALRGERAPWPSTGQDADLIDSVKTRILFHAITGLLHEQGSRLEGWPTSMREWLRNHSIGRFIWEHNHKALLGELLDRLHQAGIVARVLKGTAIAYTHYAEPALRVRGDTDLLIHEADLAQTRNVFAAMGFKRMFPTHGVFGDLHFQELLQYVDQHGQSHEIDLHWEVSNSRALRPVLDVEQFMAETVPLPRLSPRAVTVSLETRLLHGFVNRAMHGPFYLASQSSYFPQRLIWAHDYRLQLSQLTKQQWFGLAERCCQLGVSAAASDALRFASETLSVAVPREVRERLDAAPGDTFVARYIAERRPLQQALIDLQATPGVAGKLRFLLARAFPTREHMRSKYSSARSWPLAVLYLRRLFEGAARFMTGLVRSQ